HVPHCEAQQTPSMQRPVAHSLPVLHPPPTRCPSHVSPRVAPPPKPPKTTRRMRASSYTIACAIRGEGPSSLGRGAHASPLHVQTSAAPLLPPKRTTLAPGPAY